MPFPLNFFVTRIFLLLMRPFKAVMTKKNIIVLTIAFLAVAGIYFYLYKDYFTTPNIQILHTIRPKPTRGPATGEAQEVIAFGLGREYKLTSIKVVPTLAMETNKYPHPVWELTSKSNSVPLKAFIYGGKIKGMHPPVQGSQPEPLVPNIPYTLLVEAGSVKGEHHFKISEDSRVNE
ncbi:MAG: hypothetical protein JWQ71_4618 [Pedosphaera sp.]|nr:hypothetical protein [Pedosphaera sp.]